MQAPTLKICKTPRLLQRYLAGVARNLPGPAVIYNDGDAVLVLDEGEKYPGVVTEVHGGGLYEVDFEDGDDGCYCAEDFC